MLGDQVGLAIFVRYGFKSVSLRDTFAACVLVRAGSDTPPEAVSAIARQIIHNKTICKHSLLPRRRM